MRASSRAPTRPTRPPVARTRAVSSATERKTAAGRAPTAIRDRELARPPRDEVRRDAVDADGRQRQGQSGEQPDRQRVESRQGHDVREDGVHRLEVVDAEVAVHGPDLALDGVRDAGRGPLRAHDQAHQAGGRGLALREIDDRHDRLLHLMLAEVAHAPHYREPVGPSLGDPRGRAGLEPRSKLPADRLGPGPVPCRRCLVDDGDGAAVGPVRGRERPPLRQLRQSARPVRQQP